jgi:hypothetical protein
MIRVMLHITLLCYCFDMIMFIYLLNWWSLPYQFNGMGCRTVCSITLHNYYYYYYYYYYWVNLIILRNFKISRWAGAGLIINKLINMFRNLGPDPSSTAIRCYSRLVTAKNANVSNFKPVKLSSRRIWKNGHGSSGKTTLNCVANKTKAQTQVGLHPSGCFFILFIVVPFFLCSAKKARSLL